jgi:hypothetical protein
MRRLYSTFAAGLPGAGLLLMRLVVGATLLVRASSMLSDPSLNLTVLPPACMAVAGLLLIPGLWTPISGTLVVLVEIWEIWTAPGDRWVALLVATIGGALAMLGPGLWSVDALLFGWKRVAASPRSSKWSESTVR